MENAKRIDCMWGLAVSLGVGLAVVNTPAVALAAPGDSGKGVRRLANRRSHPIRRRPRRVRRRQRTTPPVTVAVMGRRRARVSPGTMRGNEMG